MATPTTGAGDGHAGVHERQARAAHRGHRRRAVGRQHLGHQAEGVGELLRGRDHREHRLLGQGAVADLAPLRAAHEAHLAGGERREVVVVHVALGVFERDRVEHLLHAQHAQGGHVEHLGLAPLEEAGAVGSWHHPHLDGDRPDVADPAAVEADALSTTRSPHHLLGDRSGRRAWPPAGLRGRPPMPSSARTAARASSSAALRSCLPAILHDLGEPGTGRLLHRGVAARRCSRRRRATRPRRSSPWTAARAGKSMIADRNGFDASRPAAIAASSVGGWPLGDEAQARPRWLRPRPWRCRCLPRRCACRRG